MNILEIERMIASGRSGATGSRIGSAASDGAPPLSPVTLGLAAGLAFLDDPPPPDRTAYPTLWDRLSLSWREPQLARDLLAPRYPGRPE